MADGVWDNDVDMSGRYKDTATVHVIFKNNILLLIINIKRLLCIFYNFF